jgi:hypothetical protein
VAAPEFVSGRIAKVDAIISEETKFRRDVIIIISFLV